MAEWRAMDLGRQALDNATWAALPTRGEESGERVPLGVPNGEERSLALAPVQLQPAPCCAPCAGPRQWVRSSSLMTACDMITHAQFAPPYHRL